MPNAKDVENQTGERILLRGSIGSGKTTQFITLPGRKFIYLFDPGALQALRGYDVDYEEYLAEKMNVTISSIPKGGAPAVPVTDQTKRYKAQAYAKFEEHFMNLLDNDLDKYDTIGFDGITGLTDIILDDVLFRAGRLGYTPEMADYNVVKATLSRILRTAASLGKVLFFTAHTMYRQNSGTNKFLNELLITGDLQIRAPLLFSSVLQTEMEVDPIKKTKRFIMQSVPDKYNENIRTNFPDMPHRFDGTIADWSKPEESGLGRLIKDATKTYEGRRRRMEAKVSPSS